MSWYEDKVKEGTASLMISGAGAGAKALGTLARVPLEIEGRKQAEYDAETARIKALSPVEKAQIDAMAKQKVASMGLKGKEATAQAKVLSSKMMAYASTTSASINASAKRYASDAGVKGKAISASAKDKATDAFKYRTQIMRDNNIDDNFTKQITSTDKNYTQRKVAKLNVDAKGTKPSTMKLVKTLDDGTVTTITKPYIPHGDFSIKKRRKKMENATKGYK